MSEEWQIKKSSVIVEKMYFLRKCVFTYENKESPGEIQQFFLQGSCVISFLFLSLFFSVRLSGITNMFCP